ncbi:hypothetical protein ACFHW2_00450 [Actinomadura sp. LOL_016]
MIDIATPAAECAAFPVLRAAECPRRPCTGPTGRTGRTAPGTAAR